MIRKWQYMSKRCADMGYEPAARIAYAIDCMLTRLRYPNHTTDWVSDRIYTPSEIDEKSLVDLAYTNKYCVACKRHAMYCEDCDFADEGGRQLFDAFINAVEDEYEEDEDEEYEHEDDDEVV